MRRISQAIRRTVRSSWQSCILFSVLFGAITFTSLSSQAASVTLSWDPNTTVSGPSYKVYYGPASGVYTNAVWIGNNTSYTVDGLNSNGTYYFAVTTFNSSGQESGYSTEAVYTFSNGQPTLVSMSTPTVVQPGQVQFTPQGTSGLQYVVQASTDLINWVSLQTNTAPFTFTDTQAGQFAKRFYRTIQAQ